MSPAFPAWAGNSAVTVVNSSSEPVPTTVGNSSSNPVPATVVNSSANPVPTTVGNSSANPIPTTVGNSSANPIPTTVGNSSANPIPTLVINSNSIPVATRDVSDPALQPFQATLFPHSATSSQATDSFTVPQGKRLVIEYYSSQAQDLSGPAGLVLTTTAGGNFVEYIVYVNGSTSNQVNQTARIYADPGSTVQAFAFNAGAATSCAGLLTVSGHLVNVP